MTKERILAEDRLDVLRRVIQDDVDKGKYYGAVVKITRGGETGFHEAFGSADAERKHRLSPDTVFSIFSVTKTFINALTLRAIELGQFALTTPVVEIIPEYSGPPRDRATVLNLLTHSAGIPGVWETEPNMQYTPFLEDQLKSVCKNIHGIVEPGTRCDYSPMVNHILLSTMLVRTDPKGRRIGDILHQDLFEPLGMIDTHMGLRKDLRDRHAIPEMRGTIPIKLPGWSEPGDFGFFREEKNEATWVGAVSTANDLSRFANMLRGEGVLGSARILSSTTVRKARKNWTGEMDNELYKVVALRAGYPPPPAYFGLGFNVRGPRIVRTQMASLTSAETFGNYGGGSQVYWVDPELDMTFVRMTTGLLSQAANIERMQRLGDIAVGAAL